MPLYPVGHRTPRTFRGQSRASSQSSVPSGTHFESWRVAESNPERLAPRLVSESGARKVTVVVVRGVGHQIMRNTPTRPGEILPGQTLHVLQGLVFGNVVKVVELEDELEDVRQPVVSPGDPSETSR